MKEKLVIALIVIAALLLLGATGHTNKPFVARANFSPQIAKPTEIAPIVTEEVQRVEVTTPPPTASQGALQDVVELSATGLTGSIGYARPGGNCVNEPGVKRQSGNPITWSVATQTPYIGATALFTFNHVGYIVGLWDNGDIEIRHQNWNGSQHRFPRSSFRGFI